GVLNAIALEYADLAIVHFHGEMDDELVLRLAEDESDVVGELDDRGGPIEILLNDLEELVTRGAGGRRARRRRASGTDDRPGGANADLTHLACFSYPRPARAARRLMPKSIQVHQRARHEEGVQTIEHAAVSGHDFARILDAGSSLEQ